ncbi:MAG: divergent polysaccharide deacetylase family protein [Rhodospirillaceae bacterium]|nr:divergent polysaccharide deacetylase family protein [Rhodospirillaceae bacterium]
MARIPRGKKQAGDSGGDRAGGRAGGRTDKVTRAPSTPAAVGLILIAGIAGLAAWLSYSHDPAKQQAELNAQATLADAVLPVDLTKDGSGKQAASKEPAKKRSEHGGETQGEEKHGEEKHGEDKHAGDKSEATPGKAAPPKTAAHKPAKDTDGHDVKPKVSSQQTADEPAPSPQPGPQPNPQPGPQPSPQDHKAVTQDGEDGEKSGHAPAKTASTHGAKSKFMASGGLRPAPDPALIKSTENGPLPVVAPDGRTPLQVYARPYKATGRPRIAIVVGSLGLSRATTMTAIQQLPGGVSLAFAPYGRNLQDYVNQARAAGHEVLLQVPMEPMDYPTNDPGPHTLLTSLTIHRNLQRLDWLLGRFAGYVGVVNFMGGRFTSTESHLQPILEAMRDRGLMFLDARASSSSVASAVAGRIGLTIAANDRGLDAVASRAAIDARLLELERLASASGGAIGIGFPYPVTIERLAQWTRAMGDRGFDLVPISAITDHQEAKN